MSTHHSSRREALALGLATATGLALPRPAVAQAKMDMLIAYYGALMNTTPVAIGLEKGYYAAPGLNIGEPVTSIGGGTAIRNMIGGGLKYGIVGTSAALSAIKEGIDVKIIHGVLRTMEDLFWVTTPTSGVKTIQDLKGKKIAFTRPKSISETMIKWMLERHHLTGQVELVSLGSVGAGLSALERGEVHAALTLEPLNSARPGRYQVVFTLSELPPMVQMVGVATSDFVKGEPERVRGLVKAWRQSVDFTYANPDEAAAIMSKRFGDRTFPLPVAKLATQNMIKIKFWSRGEIDREGLKIWLRTMVEQGEWTGEADWGKMIDDQFLDKDLKT